MHSTDGGIATGIRAGEPLELARSERAAHFFFEGTLIVVWQDVPLAEDVEVLRRVATRLVEDGRRPFAVLQQLAPNTGMPSASVRSGLVNVWLDVGRNLACMSLVLGGDGFWASAARSAINGMMLAAGKRLPLRVSGKLEQDLHWLLRELRKRRGEAPTYTELRAALEYVERSR